MAVNLSFIDVLTKIGPWPLLGTVSSIRECRLIKFKCDSGKLVESSTHEPGLVDGSSESRIGNQLESLKLKFVLVKKPIHLYSKSCFIYYKKNCFMVSKMDWGHSKKPYFWFQAFFVIIFKFLHWKLKSSKNCNSLFQANLTAIWNPHYSYGTQCIVYNYLYYLVNTLRLVLWSGLHQRLFECPKV